MKLLVLTVIAGCLLGCTSDRVDLYHSDYDPITQSYWTNVKSAMDTVGGERSELLCASNRYGAIQRCWDSHGPGMLQGFMAGGFAGMTQGAGVASGMALLRPATTNYANSLNSGGATIGAGAATASASPITTASNTASNTASPQVTTKAVGRGGAGGNAVATGGAGGQGGMATASPVLTANPVANASPVVTASPVVSNMASATGGVANATGGVANAKSASNAAAAAKARSAQSQNQGQWNCINSPPCN
jgi:hypothetical protein